MDAAMSGARRHRPHRGSRLSDSVLKHDTAEEHRNGRQAEEDRPVGPSMRVLADLGPQLARHAEGGSHVPPSSCRSVSKLHP